MSTTVFEKRKLQTNDRENDLKPLEPKHGRPTVKVNF